MFKRVFLIFLCNTFFHGICHGNWSKPEPISSFALISGEVSLACNRSNGEMVAVWCTIWPFNAPNYSIYKDESWSAPAPIAWFASSSSDIFVKSDDKNGAVYASWADEGKMPVFAIYTDGAWSRLDWIDRSATVAGGVVLAYNGQMCAAWKDKESGFPTYAIYDSIKWAPSAPISSLSMADGEIRLVSNGPEVLFAAWKDKNSGYAMFSIYSNGHWSSCAPISSMVLAADTISLSCNVQTGEVFAAWANPAISQPVYTIYAGGKWSPASPISSSHQTYNRVSLEFDEKNGLMFAGWQEKVNPYMEPSYAIYSSGSGWSQAASLASSLINMSPSFAYNNTTGQMFVAWHHFKKSSFYPIYSIWTDMERPPPDPGL